MREQSPPFYNFSSKRRGFVRAGWEECRVIATLGGKHIDLSLAIPFENWFGEAPFCICIERLISSHVSR
jgi:hypothetical protein